MEGQREGGTRQPLLLAGWARLWAGHSGDGHSGTESSGLCTCLGLNTAILFPSPQAMLSQPLTVRSSLVYDTQLKSHRDLSRG